MKSAYDVIIKPVISERSMDQAANKKYTFKVAVDANKTQVKHAIEEIFDVEVKKVNVNVIEVFASSLDEIEEMASKDVEDTKEKLESERDALSEEIKDFDAYTKNIDKVKAYYEDALKQTELLSIRLREYAYKYAELIMNEDVSYKVKYKDLSGIYEYI